jgi:hypothetical protein
MELSRLMLSNMHLGGDLQVFLLQIAAPRAHLRIRHEGIADVPAAASAAAAAGTRRIIVLFLTCMKQTKRVILK